MAKILIIVLSESHKDPRVQRQISSLENHHQLTVAAYTNPKVSNIEFIRIVERPPNKLFKKIFNAGILFFGYYEKYYWSQSEVRQLVKKIKCNQYDLIIANDIETLPISLLLANNGHVIVDLHEYSPCECDDLLVFRLFLKKYKTYLCKRYIKSANSAITVSPNISNAYSKLTGVMPYIVSNATDYKEITPKFISKYPVKIIHHGAAIRSRKLELMIKMMSLLDSKYELHLMLVGDKKYIRKLEKFSNSKNIYFHDPVEYPEIVNTISKYDLGIFYLYPSNFNNEYALPNKIFEFVQARLPILIGPSPEMRNLVNGYKIGVVSEEFTIESLAQKIESLSIDKINRYKENVHAVAKILCTGKYKDNYYDVVSKSL
ncbi:MAG: glycosyltransferase [Gammaproteobacteria bacterium]